MENSCGKSCGECGKLLVINRYFYVLEILFPLWKICIQLCIMVFGDWDFGMLRYRFRVIIWKQKISQKFTFCKNSVSEFDETEIVLKIFCEKSPKRCRRYHLPEPGNTSPSNRIDTDSCQIPLCGACCFGSEHRR